MTENKIDDEPKVRVYRHRYRGYAYFCFKDLKLTYVGSCVFSVRVDMREVETTEVETIPEASTQNPLPEPLPPCPSCHERNMVLIVLERPYFRCERCNKNFSNPCIYENP